MSLNLRAVCMETVTMVNAQSISSLSGRLDECVRDRCNIWMVKYWRRKRQSTRLPQNRFRGSGG